MTIAATDTMRRLIPSVKLGYSLDQEFYVSDAVFKADMDALVNPKAAIISEPYRDSKDFTPSRISAKNFGNTSESQALSGIAIFDDSTGWKDSLSNASLRITFFTSKSLPGIGAS